jgi:hypothetical protein
MSGFTPEERDKQIAWLEEKRLRALDHLEALQQDVANAEAVLEKIAAACQTAHRLREEESA